MTPQTKARKLIEKFISDGLHQKHMGITSARQCALITVDEIIANNEKIPGNINGLHIDSNTLYWQEVKQEIEKL